MHNLYAIYIINICSAYKIDARTKKINIRWYSIQHYIGAIFLAFS